MRLQKFLSYGVGGQKTNLVIIWGGSASVRTYVLRLFEERFALPRKVVYRLPEVEESVWKLFSYLPDTLQIIFWDKNSLDKEELAHMMRSFGRLPQVTIILDPTDEAKSVLVDSVSKSYLRRHIDCTLPSGADEKGVFYERWFSEKEKFDVSPRLISHAVSRPFSESFNMIKTLKLVGEENLNLITAQKFGLLWTDEEQYFVDSLISKGRGYVLKTNWRGLDAARTIYLLYLRVHMLLKVKTLQGRYVSEILGKLKLSQHAYYLLKDTAQKLELKVLYKRLYLLSSLLKWRNYDGVLNLLLLYW